MPIMIETTAMFGPSLDERSPRGAISGKAIAVPVSDDSGAQKKDMVTEGDHAISLTLVPTAALQLIIRYPATPRVPTWFRRRRS